MKNGCKDFVSPTMDKLKIDKSSENRLHDIRYAQVFLGIANRRGYALEESRQLTTELYEYIVYLYSHIEQLEKDKRYLLEQRLKENQRLKEQNAALQWANKSIIKTEKERRRQLWDKINRIEKILSEKNGVADSQEFGLHYGQIHNYLNQIEEVINEIKE